MNVLARRKDDFFSFELLVIFTSKVVTNAILALVTTSFVTNAKMALVTTPGDDRVNNEHPTYIVFHSSTIVHYNNNTFNKDTIILCFMFNRLIAANRLDIILDKLI